MRQQYGAMAWHWFTADHYCCVSVSKSMAKHSCCWLRQTLSVCWRSSLVLLLRYTTASWWYVTMLVYSLYICWLSIASLYSLLLIFYSSFCGFVFLSSCVMHQGQIQELGLGPASPFAHTFHPFTFFPFPYHPFPSLPSCSLPSFFLFLFSSPFSWLRGLIEHLSFPGRSKCFPVPFKLKMMHLVSVHTMALCLIHAKTVRVNSLGAHS